MALQKTKVLSVSLGGLIISGLEFPSSEHTRKPSPQSLPVPNKPIFRGCCHHPLPRPSLQLENWLLQRLWVIVWWRQDAEGVGG